jgi:SAM-dependent methyltransferase
MSEPDITQLSRKFYEQYQFPGDRPIDQDGLIFMRRFTKSIVSTSSKAHGFKLRVLDAGCGTGNTSVALARRFKDVDFFGFDNSRTSVEKAISLAKQNGLSNINFRKWNLMHPFPFKYQFDIIFCLGVLHHTADMKKGLIHLHNSLKKNGELYLWIYGRHGRYSHSLNTRLLNMLLNTKPKPANVMELVKEFVFKADNGSVVNDLLGKTKTDMMLGNTLENPVWIADQFLNPHETLLDMEGLLELIRATGFKIKHVLGMKENTSDYFNSLPLYQRFLKLNNDRKLIALDLLTKPERYFIILRKGPYKKSNK